MRKYIFITHSIKNVGGVQCYLAAKAKYLEDHGWKVYVFYAGNMSSRYKCPINYLEKYVSGNILWLGIAPFKMPRWLISKTLKRMLRLIGNIDVDDENLIESHADTFSQWGEMLASRIQGRHYFYTMNEGFRGKSQCYEQKMDFYIFKFNRKEILGAQSTFNRLFEGYLKITSADYPGDFYIDESPIQDVYNENVSLLTKKDWNICYIGRSNKSYVPSIISDVGRFAELHPEKEIQFVIVTDPGCCKEQTSKIKSCHSNLYISELGLLHPIPKELYSKVDVVIAGAGSARHSCEEGALVIVADTETKKANGILGYETMDSVYNQKDSVVTDFCEALERVLVEKVYLKLDNKYPKRKPVEYSVLHNFALYEQSERQKIYYDESRLLEGDTNYLAMMTTWLAHNFPKFLIRLARLLGKC